MVFSSRPCGSAWSARGCRGHFACRDVFGQHASPFASMRWSVGSLSSSTPASIVRLGVSPPNSAASSLSAQLGSSSVARGDAARPGRDPAGFRWDSRTAFGAAAGDGGRDLARIVVARGRARRRGRRDRAPAGGAAPGQPRQSARHRQVARLRPDPQPPRRLRISSFQVRQWAAPCAHGAGWRYSRVLLVRHRARRACRCGSALGNGTRTSRCRRPNGTVG